MLFKDAQVQCRVLIYQNNIEKISQDFVKKNSHFIILIDFKSFTSRYYGRLVLTSEMTTKPVLRDELALTKITVEGLLVS